MKMCLWCKQNESKPTLSFYCRWCYIYLQQRYGLNVDDYKLYSKTMYNKKVIVYDCEYKSLYDIHNHFLCNLHLTDKRNVRNNTIFESCCNELGN